MVIAFVMAVVMNVGSYWFSDTIVLKMYGAREVPESEAPRLHAIVRRLATAAGTPMPKVCVIPGDSPNAFATGRNPEHAAVAATEGILRMLPEDELEAVLAHEMGHVRNRDILIGTVAATIAGAIMMIAHMAQFAAFFGGGRDRDGEGGGGGVVGMLLLAVLAPLGASLIQMAMSRSREYLADETGARLCGNPLALARALQRISGAAEAVPLESAGPATAHLFIVNPLSAGGIAGLFSTHPPVEERVARLRAMAGGAR
jgi:heat shock protein HtpX